MIQLAALDIGDPPEVWADLGFAVEGNRCTVGDVVHRLGAGGKGVVAWTLRGVEGDLEGHIDGLAAGMVDGATPAPSPTEHPNGALAIDHLVVSTPHVDRTVAALEEIGLDLRRTREGEAYGAAMRQAFFRLGPVVLEVVGPPEPQGDNPARFFGLAFTVADLAATAAWFGDRLKPARDAVQPGRQIATLAKEAGTTVAMAFMSPEP